MSNGCDSIDQRRRRLVGAGVIAAGAARLRLADAASAATLSSVSTAAGPSEAPLAFVRPMLVRAGDLDVGFIEVGPRSGRPVILLHGWPYDVHAFVKVAPLLASAGYRVIIPHLRGHGTTRFRSPTAMRNGQQAAIGVDVVALMDALQLPTALIAGFDWGARAACTVAALWPERCKGLVTVSGYLISSQQAGLAPLRPGAERDWWYQFYFATERGRVGYEANRTDFAKLIWQTASPGWRFDDAIFARSAASLYNPDHVAIVIHNYRWRLGLENGEGRYDELERRLAAAPTIAVPSISMEGDANGAPHPDPASYRRMFTGRYEHRLITGGIGHALPQEASRSFADAIISVDGL